MPAITAAGIGSGLDIEGIVQSLMALERRPLNQLQARQNTFETQLSAYGKIKSALSSFQTAMQDLSSVSKFQVHTATSSDDSIFTSTASSSAVPGTYSIQFDDNGTHQLATADTMNSTVAVADGDTSIGTTGDVTIDVGGSAFTITVDATNDTLNGIRDAINNASDNTGVTATVVNADGGATLILTSENTGTDDTITITDATNLGLTTVSAAQDAIVTIGGFQVTSTSNSITSAIDGVTINLKALDTAGVTQTLTIGRDTDKVTESVQAFVDAYNELRSTMSSQRAGTLSGDNGLLSIESRMRSIMNTAPAAITSNFSFLAELGITTQEGGDLTLDSADLKTALDADFSGVAQLLANDAEGYIFRLEAVVDDFLDFDGLIDSREDGLGANIDRLEDQKLQMEYRLELIEKRYRAQFTAMDQLVASLQATGAFLTQQLASLSQIRIPRN
jgi:flagellar hook-associated protein 2